MHFPWSFILFSTYGLYFLPGSNFAPFEEVKVPVSNSADFFQESAPWRILEDLGWLGLKTFILFKNQKKQKQIVVYKKKKSLRLYIFIGIYVFGG